MNHLDFKCKICDADLTRVSHRSNCPDYFGPKPKVAICSTCGGTNGSHNFTCPFYYATEKESLTPIKDAIDRKTKVDINLDWSPLPPIPAPLAGSIDSILSERGKEYGKFTKHAAVTQQLKTIMKHHSEINWINLHPDQKEALEMIAHKIGRILNGNPNNVDSWADIAGYAKLVADRLGGIER